MPRFSVVLPAYNAQAFIRQTIESILAQTFPDFEIVVIDDGSSDATAEIAAAMDPRIRVMKQRNQGIALARNAGVAAATGEWICFMDHDDLWHPQKLSVQASVLDSDSGCGVVYGEFRRWDPRTPAAFEDIDLDAERIVGALSGMILPRLVQTNWILLSTAVVRRQIFDRVGLFDPAMPPADDWDFMLRVAEHFRFTKLAQPLALYRVHPGQTSRKLTPTNIEFDLRQRALDRVREIGGPEPDLADVHRRQFHALVNYGLMQYDAGHYRESCASFFNALKRQPTAVRIAVHLAASCVRSILPGRSRVVDKALASPRYAGLLTGDEKQRSQCGAEEEREAVASRSGPASN